MIRHRHALRPFAGSSIVLLAFAFFVSPSPRADDAPRHRILVCEYGDKAHRVLEISPDGKATWEHKFPAYGVCCRAEAGGGVLFADGGSPTLVQAVTRDHAVVFEYKPACQQVMNCDRLPNGDVLLAEQGPCQAVEVDPKGQVVSTVKLTTSEVEAHRQLRSLHRLPDGHLLACHEHEGVVREYDAAGHVVWEFANVDAVFDALRLADGHTLIACGTQKRIIEVTADKKIVWSFTDADAPQLNLTWVTSLQVLKNGNVVAANFLRGQEGKGAHAFEVTHDAAKKVVWQYAAHDLVRSITMVQVVDEGE